MAYSTTGNLFSQTSAHANADESAPLAERMRPRSLEVFVGQEHLVGDDRILRKLLEGSGNLPSLVLWVGPGTGKTTLARVVAANSGVCVIAVSAVFSGVIDLRAAFAAAKQ